MSLQINTICESISDLNIAGVKIRGLDEIPEAVEQRQPTIFPKPDGFVTDFTVERNSFGGASEKETVHYTLNYRLCHTPLGSERGLFVSYPAMVECAFAFLDAIIGLGVLTGAVDILPADAVNFGPVSDPAGNMFHGCDIQLRVMEFVN